MADSDDEDKFTYVDPRTGKGSQRSVNPGFWETTKERMVDSADIDKQREAARVGRAAKSMRDKYKRGE